jgi:hypothetical protein
VDNIEGYVDCYQHSHYIVHYWMEQYTEEEALNLDSILDRSVKEGLEEVQVVR